MEEDELSARMEYYIQTIQMWIFTEKSSSHFDNRKFKDTSNMHQNGRLMTFKGFFRCLKLNFRHFKVSAQNLFLSAVCSKYGWTRVFARTQTCWHLLFDKASWRRRQMFDCKDRNRYKEKVRFGLPYLT